MSVNTLREGSVPVNCKPGDPPSCGPISPLAGTSADQKLERMVRASNSAPTSNGGAAFVK